MRLKFQNVFQRLWHQGDVQQAQEVSDTVEAETVSVEDDQDTDSDDTEKKLQKISGMTEKRIVFCNGS